MYTVGLPYYSRCIPVLRYSEAYKRLKIININDINLDVLLYWIKETGIMYLVGLCNVSRNLF